MTGSPVHFPVPMMDVGYRVVATSKEQDSNYDRPMYAEVVGDQNTGVFRPTPSDTRNYVVEPLISSDQVQMADLVSIVILLAKCRPICLIQSGRPVLPVLGSQSLLSGKLPDEITKSPGGCLRLSMFLNTQLRQPQLRSHRPWSAIQLRIQSLMQTRS